VIALNTGTIERSNDVQAFFGIGIVTDHIPQACHVCAFLLLDVIQDHLQRFEIRVYISYNRVLHLKPDPL
jgi:hypothetical protein